MLNNVNTVLTSNVAGANTGTSLLNIVAGDVLVLNKNNTNLTGTPTPSSAVGNDVIRIALGLPAGLPDSDKTLRLSADIESGKVQSWTKADYVAPTEQSSVVTVASLLNSTEYRLRIIFKDRHRFRPHRQSGADFYYTTAASASEINAALSFAKKVNTSKRLSDMRRKLETEVAASGGTITEFTNNATVTNGSITVTSTSHGASVGDYVTLQDVIYKVAAVIDANTFELDRPYTGTTETIDVVATVDKAGTIASPTGITLTIKGLPITTRSADYYQQLDFKVGLAPVNGDLGEEMAVSTTAAEPGSGYWEQIRDMEFKEAAYRGITNRRQFPIDDFKPIAQSGGTYRIYTIKHYSVARSGHESLQNPAATILAFDISGGTTKADAVEAILDSWITAQNIPSVA